MWVENVATGSAAGPLAGALAGRTSRRGTARDDALSRSGLVEYSRTQSVLQ